MSQEEVETESKAGLDYLISHHFNGGEMGRGMGRAQRPGNWREVLAKNGLGPLIT